MKGRDLSFCPLFSLYILHSTIGSPTLGDIIWEAINWTHRTSVFPCTISWVSNSCSWRYNVLSPTESTATYATRYQLWTRSRVKITLACTETPYETRQVELVGRDVICATCSAAYAFAVQWGRLPSNIRLI